MNKSTRNQRDWADWYGNRSFFAMALLLLFVARLCLTSPMQLSMQLSDDDWMALYAVLSISVALLISHKVHMLTGR